MAYHPQTDGQAKRLNQEVEQFLQIFMKQHQDNWYNWLAIAEFAYNVQVHASMHSSPFMLDTRQNPQFSIELMRVTPRDAQQLHLPDRSSNEGSMFSPFPGSWWHGLILWHPSQRILVRVCPLWSPIIWAEPIVWAELTSSNWSLHPSLCHQLIPSVHPHWLLSLVHLWLGEVCLCNYIVDQMQLAPLSLISEALGKLDNFPPWNTLGKSYKYIKYLINIIKYNII